MYEIFNEAYLVIQNQLANIGENQFATGGIIIGLITGVGLWLRNLPRTIYSNIKSLTITTVEIKNDSPFFHTLENWFREENPCKWSKSFRLTSTADNINNSIDKFTMGEGSHWFFYKRTLVVVSRSVDRELKVQYQKIPEILNFKFYTRRKSKVQKFFDDVFQKYVDDTPCINVYANDNTYWEYITKIEIGGPHNVVLDGSTYEDIVDDVETFFSKKDWYKERGLSFRRGYLFDGPPGTGKTSTIKSLARKMGMNLYVLSGAGKMRKEDMISALSDIRPKSFVIIEDIDAVFDQQTKRDFADEEEGEDPSKAKSSLSDLLNSLDGLTSKENYILIMTTNHIEKLDPALIRPGRVDRIFHFGKLTPNQMGKLIKKFFPDADSEKIETISKKSNKKVITPAELQEILISSNDISEVSSKVDNF